MIPKNRKIKIMILILTLGGSFALAQEKDQADHRAAFEACLAELGIEKPQPGERPKMFDESTRESVDACLKEKGFEPPKFGHRGPPPEGAGHRPPPLRERRSDEAGGTR